MVEVVRQQLEADWPQTRCHLTACPQWPPLAHVTVPLDSNQAPSLVQGARPVLLNATLSQCFTQPQAALTFVTLPGFPFSQKDLENLKAEVQRRQQLQESIKSGEQLEAEDKAVEEKEAEPSMPSAAIPLTQSSA